MNDAPDGGLTRAPTDGGEASTVTAATGGGAYGFVALDDSYVFWGYANRILRAPK